jgi:ABC-2 type transport system ATP-binding protein
MRDLAIETTLLTGGYGKTVVLREVSLKIPRGSIYGFLGPNGAGKTTLMRMLLGLLHPVSGEIHVFGAPLHPALPGILKRIGSLIEQPSLYDHLTGAENLEIARTLKFASHADVTLAIEAAGVEAFLTQRVREYSRGMRQRLGVATALLGRPELLLLDEPMNGMDAQGLRTFRSVLQSLNREHGTTILLSSHQFEEVEQVATDIGILSSTGDLLFQGPRAALSERVPQTLHIQVDRWDDAMRALHLAGYNAEFERDSIRVSGAAKEMAGEINRLLVSIGIEVTHLALDAVSLEALFMKVTTTVQAWERV